MPDKKDDNEPSAKQKRVQNKFKSAVVKYKKYKNAFEKSKKKKKGKGKKEKPKMLKDFIKAEFAR